MSKKMLLQNGGSVRVNMKFDPYRNKDGFVGLWHNVQAFDDSNQELGPLNFKQVLN